MENINNPQEELLEALVLKDINRLRATLDEIVELKGKESLVLALNAKSYYGKSLTDLSSALGLEEILRMLIKRGANVNCTPGYGPIHHAACWGKTACLEILYENNADIVCRTNNGQSAKDLAVKYSQNESMDFLDWAESEYLLIKEKAVTAVKPESKKKA